MGRNAYFIDYAVIALRQEKKELEELQAQEQAQQKRVRSRVSYLRSVCSDDEEKKQVEEKLVEIGLAAPPKRVIEGSMVEKAEAQSSGRAERVLKRKK